MKRKRGVLAVAAVVVLFLVVLVALRRQPSTAPPTPGPGIPAHAPLAAAPASSSAPHPAAPVSSPEPLVSATTSRSVILVRDSVAGSPIPGARVYVHPNGQGGCRGSPFPLPSCLAEGPVGATDAEGRYERKVVAGANTNLHVFASGHRWGRLQAIEGEAMIWVLERGAAVRLTVGRWGELEEPLLFAERGDIPADVDPEVPAGRGVAEAEEFETIIDPPDAHPVPVPGPGSDTTTDEGIAAGTWTYFVRRGTRDGEIYARGVVTVAEGEVAELRLDAVPVTAGPRFPVKATVLVPKGWGFDPRTGWIQDFDVEVAQDAFIADPEPFLSLKGLDPLNRHLEATASYEKAGADGLFRVLLKPDLPAGRYRAAVGPVGFVTEVEVAGPSPEVRIELPEPGEVRVTLLDSSTGKPVADGWVRWAPAWKGLPRGQLETLSVDKGTGSVALRAPPGTCHVDLGAGGYLDGERSLSFVAGSTAEVKVALRPAAVLVVRVRLDGKPFEGGGWAEAKLRVDSEELERLAAESETGGVVTSMASGFQGGEARIDGLWAGPHEVTVTHLPGLESVPPRSVEVRFGTETVVEFDLVRAKGE